MTVELALLNRMLNFAPLNTLVGFRIYPLILPQKPTMPAITYQQISATPYSTINQASGLALYRVQLSCYGNTYNEAKAVSKQVLSALQRFTGEGLQDVAIENEFDDYEQDTKLYKVVIDVEPHYED